MLDRRDTGALVSRENGDQPMFGPQDDLDVGNSGSH